MVLGFVDFFWFTSRVLDVAEDGLHVAALLVQGLDTGGGTVKGASRVESQQCTDLDGVQARLALVHLHPSIGCTRGSITSKVIPSKQTWKAEPNYAAAAAAGHACVYLVVVGEDGAELGAASVLVVVEVVAHAHRLIAVGQLVDTLMPLVVLQQ
jgi:hypothetical protein